MHTLFRVLLLLTLPWLASSSYGAPLRVALEPLPDLRPPSPELSFQAAMGMCLRERLADSQAMTLVSDGWVQTVLLDLWGGARNVSDDDLLAAMNVHVPCDVLIRFQLQDTAAVAIVHLADGVQLVKVKRDPKWTTQDLVLKLSAELANVLKLPEVDRKRLVDRRMENADLFLACYTSPLRSMAYPENPGEARMEMLEPFIDSVATSPLLIDRMFDAASIQIRAVNRSQSLTGSMVTLLKVEVLPAALGTEAEQSTWSVLKLRPEVFEGYLVETAKPVLVDQVDSLLEEGLLEDDDTSELKEGPNRAARLGALRLLGVIQSKAGLPVLQEAASKSDADIRTAAAFALRFYEAEVGVEELRKLVTEKDSPVAYVAAASLFTRGIADPRVLTIARGELKQNPQSLEALRVVAGLSTAEDRATLQKYLASTNPEARVVAASGLARLGKLDPVGLNDSNDQVVDLVLKNLPESISDEVLKQIFQLANNPLASLADSARLALIKHRPADLAKAQQFDLEVDHPYVRMRIVDKLAEQHDLAALEAACKNNNAHVRIRAIEKLSEQSAERAHPLLLKMIKDPFKLVRLHVAVLLARSAKPADAKALSERLATESDAATRLYLQDALAAAGGKTTPEKPAGARLVAGKKNLTWLCGTGSDVANSPFEAYYMLSAAVDDNWKKGYEAGKIFFARVDVIGNSGSIIVDPYSMDSYWIALDQSLSEQNLPWLDGLVFGEESMNTDASQLWQPGWRLFCLDAGIDPARVAGDIEKLSEIEQRAWRYWAEERIVDGFNQLYDHVKLKYGRLRPGLQVCTFLPGQGGITVADRRWKFDVGGIYDYKGDNRMAAYNLVRRMKTIWPERPVLWLSLGIGGYEMNPVQYNQDVPAGPFVDRSDRCWADSLTAYMAGADTGWFSVWFWVAPDGAPTSGVQMVVEDLVPAAPKLEAGIRFSFAGIEKRIVRKNQPEPEIEATGEKPEDSLLAELAGNSPEDQQAKANLEVENTKDAFRLGFNAYRHYVYDCARIFASLPRTQAKPQALFVEPNVSVWTRPASGNPLVPAAALLNEYDYLTDLNIAAELDLSQYRMIVVHRPELLRDATIEAITNWLRDVPGVLYVSSNIPYDNSLEFSTPQDLDGKLQKNWPWEKDISIKLLPEAKQSANSTLVSTFEITGGKVKPLAKLEGQTCLAAWSDPKNFKGAVVFEGVESASKEYLATLRQTLNKLNSDQGVGMPINGKLLHESYRDAALGMTAAATTGYYYDTMDRSNLEGFDTLTGETDPQVGEGRSGALILKKLQGKYLHTEDGVTFLFEQPGFEVKKTKDGWAVKSDGQIRISGDISKLAITTKSGKELPEPEKPAWWIVAGQEPGLMKWTVGEKSNPLIFVRSSETISVLKQ